MGSTRKKSRSPDPRPGADVRPQHEPQHQDARQPSAARPDEMPPEVLEFITAIDEYKRSHRRPFPTWSEVLEILKSLGYERSH
jgi:hypothetical protein